MAGKPLGDKQGRDNARFRDFSDDVLKAAVGDVRNTIWAAMQGKQEAQVVALPSRRK